MEVRPDTSSSSGRFRGQWSFLANTPHHAQPRSLPPSSYLPQSDRSSISPHHYYGTSGSRSTLPRNLTTASIGGRSSTTVPSQPVLIRVHSADASAHLNPAPRPRRPINMSRNGLPAVSEFSIAGILAAIEEDVEADINTISEILGRSRLVLADQHESHMPPTGEIRAMPYSLQAVEEASASSERLASDDVLILREDASLVDGSHTGSAAYGLLERLQAMPRNSRVSSDVPYNRMLQSPSVPSSPTSPTRHNSSPTALDPDISEHGTQRASRQLLISSEPVAPRTTSAIVSETRLFAGANGVVIDNPSMLDEPSLYLDIHDFDANEGSESNASNNRVTIRERVQNLLYVSDPTGLTAWLQGQPSRQTTLGQDAEHHLRGLLGR